MLLWTPVLVVLGGCLLSPLSAVTVENCPTTTPMPTATPTPATPTPQMNMTATASVPCFPSCFTNSSEIDDIGQSIPTLCIPTYLSLHNCDAYLYDYAFLAVLYQLQQMCTQVYSNRAVVYLYYLMRSFCCFHGIVPQSQQSSTGCHLTDHLMTFCSSHSDNTAGTPSTAGCVEENRNDVCGSNVRAPVNADKHIPVLNYTFTCGYPRDMLSCQVVLRADRAADSAVLATNNFTLEFFVFDVACPDAFIIYKDSISPENLLLGPTCNSDPRAISAGQTITLENGASTIIIVLDLDPTILSSGAGYALSYRYC